MLGLLRFQMWKTTSNTLGNVLLAGLDEYGFLSADSNGLGIFRLYCFPRLDRLPDPLSRESCLPARCSTHVRRDSPQVCARVCVGSLSLLFLPFSSSCLPLSSGEHAITIPNPTGHSPILNHEQHISPSLPPSLSLSSHVQAAPSRKLGFVCLSSIVVSDHRRSVNSLFCCNSESRVHRSAESHGPHDD